MKPFSKQALAGFTLIEMLVVIAIIGILAAIAAPNWLTWLTKQRVNSAQAEALVVLREAQANAKREKRIWQACFRDDGTRVQWSVQPLPPNIGSPVNKCLNPGESSTSGIVWNNLTDESSDLIAIDTTKSNLSEAGNNAYSVMFQYKGLLVESPSQTGVLTFGTRQNPGQKGVKEGTKRCVAVITLLGATSAASDNDCSSLMPIAKP
ncbi:type II secretion system protein [Phormidium sp. LEGE 05292]|uniref:pilus assembly FimT family protein n=1 Tax=[Phormidium] sp. LEGE 05292 TaxID=767427 RepID=UPI00187E105A|nr:type II secretion system protein [Phormidium sp. LEGE 05292]MBE9229328.1 type II secretion system protein [Phormidium sp. LEGE 05292]